MKKLLILLILVICLSLVGCGLFDKKKKNPVSPSRNLVVEGNVYNPSFSWFGSKAWAAAIRLADVSASQMIQIDTTVSNLTGTTWYDLRVVVEIEDSIFLTSEEWKCNIWYDRLDSNGAIGYEVWRVNSFPGICEGPPKDTTIICDDTVYDCANPSWIIDYTPSGNGYWRADLTIPELLGGDTFTSSIGYNNSAMSIKNDYIARWAVYDSNDTLITSREYLFNIIP